MSFNEAWAGFIEQTGVRLWLESSGRSARLPGWLKQESAGIQFNSLLQDIQKKLNALYASDLPEEQMRTEKVRVFGNLQDAYRQMVELQWDGHSYYSAMFSRELNNASLALVNSYQGGFCAFTQLYQSAQEDMGRFQQLAREKAKLNAEQRRAWLQQSCEVIASGSDL
jgi:predicted aminopeptidase